MHARTRRHITHILVNYESYSFRILAYMSAKVCERSELLYLFRYDSGITHLPGTCQSSGCHVTDLDGVFVRVNFRCPGFLDFLLNFFNTILIILLHNISYLCMLQVPLWNMFFRWVISEENMLFVMRGRKK